MPKRLSLILICLVVLAVVGTFVTYYLATVGVVLPPPAPGAGLRLLTSSTVLNRVWLENWPSVRFEAWLDDNLWLGFWVTAALAAAEWSLYMLVASNPGFLRNLVFQPPPACLTPLRLSQAQRRRPDQYHAQILALDELASRRVRQGPVRAMFGLKSISSEEIDRLGTWWAFKKRPGDAVGRLKAGSSIPTEVDRSMTVLLEAKTADQALWRSAADLLRAPGDGDVRILVLSADDFPAVVGRLPSDLQTVLLDCLRPYRQVAGLVPEPPTGKKPYSKDIGSRDTDGRSDQKSVIRRRPAASFIPVPPLPDQDEAESNSNGAAHIIDKLIAEFGGGTGLKLAVLSAIGFARPVASELRYAIAPEAADRLAIREGFKGQGLEFGDEDVVPAITKQGLAWQLFLQAMARMQGADRRALVNALTVNPGSPLASFVQTVGAGQIYDADEETFDPSKPKHVPYLAALAGPIEGKRLLGVRSSDFLRDQPNLDLALASVIQAIWSRPEGTAWFKTSGLQDYLRDIAPEALRRVGDGNRTALVENLARLYPRNGPLIQSMGQSELWLDHPFAFAEVLKSLNPPADYQARPVAADEPIYDSYSAFILMNDCFEVVVLDRQDVSRQELLARADELLPLLDSPEVVDQTMFAWAAFWLMGGSAQEAVGEPTDAFTTRVVSLLARADTEPGPWVFLAQTYARMVQGPIVGDPIYNWAVFADQPGPRPQLTTQPRAHLETATDMLLSQAGRRLKHPDSSVRYAAAVLTLAFHTDTAAIAEVILALADPTRSRREDILIRVAQSGSEAAASALADLFRSSDEEWLRTRIFLALLVRDDAAGLSDADLLAVADQGEEYLETRRAVLARHTEGTSNPEKPREAEPDDVKAASQIVPPITVQTLPALQDEPA